MLHTPGGLVLAAQQIASALADHPAPVTAVVPHYAMSGGTLIALAADEIVLDAHAVARPRRPAARPVPGRVARSAALEAPGDHDDQTLILADMSPQGDRPGRGLRRRACWSANARARARREVARLLATGHLDARPSAAGAELETLGLPVKVGVAEEERELMTLYPQPRGREAAVEYVPAAPARRATASAASRIASRRRKAVTISRRSR